MSSNELREERWMIEGVGVGARDTGTPVLWFTVTDGEGHAALQVIRWDDERAKKLLESVYEAHELNGRMCVVELDPDAGPVLGGTVTFVRLLPAPSRRPS